MQTLFLMYRMIATEMKIYKKILSSSHKKVKGIKTVILVFSFHPTIIYTIK